jgi:hypothetical protein
MEDCVLICLPSVPGRLLLKVSLARERSMMQILILPLFSVLNLAYIWFFPSSRFLFTVCYCASHGPLAFSIATWRNSAVFHSLEKMTSLFIHLYPPIVFCAIRHFMPIELRHQRFPATRKLPELEGWTAFAFVSKLGGLAKGCQALTHVPQNVAFYLIWQLL